jgi:hypothetical protein
MVPAVVLFLGWGLRSLSPDRVRRITIAALAVISILLFASPRHLWMSEGFGTDDWRSAAAAERDLVTDPSTPVFFRIGYGESSAIASFSDPKKRAALLSPLSIYPMNGRIVPLPFQLDRSADRYLNRVTRGEVVQARRLVLVTNVAFDAFRTWLDGRLQPLGFESRVYGRFGGVVLVVFDR